MAPSNSNDLNRQAQTPSSNAEVQQSLQDKSMTTHPALARLQQKLDRQAGDDASGGGGNYSRSCFPSGTRILLGDRTTKAIEDVSIGDVVMGFDGLKPVPILVEDFEAPIRDHFCTLSFADGSSIRLTKEHPVYTTRGWRSLSPESTAEENAQLLVGKLEIGDQLLNAANEYTLLTGVRYTSDGIQTYNLKKLSRYDTFYADGFLVHNKAQMALCGKCTAGFADFACLTSPVHCLPVPGHVAPHLAGGYLQTHQ
jgi:hypothetical protein